MTSVSAQRPAPVRPKGGAGVQSRSPGGYERPSHLARLDIVTVPLYPGEPDDTEQPTGAAELTVVLESLSATGPAEIEEPSPLADWRITVELLPPWDKLPGPLQPDEA